jgi:hypothetical protein
MSKQDEYAGKDKVAYKKCGTTRVYKSELRRGDGMCSQCKDDSLTVREIDEEIQDVLAWGYILHERLRVLRVLRSFLPRKGPIAVVAMGKVDPDLLSGVCGVVAEV